MNPAKLYRKYFHKLTDWIRFVEGYDIFRLYDTVKVRKAKYRFYRDEREVLIGEVTYLQRGYDRHDSLVTRRCIIDLGDIFSSACTCEDNKYRCKICKHIVACLLQALFTGEIRPETLEISVLATDNREDEEDEAKIFSIDLKRYKGDGVRR